MSKKEQPGTLIPVTRGAHSTRFSGGNFFSELPEKLTALFPACVDVDKQKKLAEELGKGIAGIFKGMLPANKGKKKSSPASASASKSTEPPVKPGNIPPGSSSGKRKAAVTATDATAAATATGTARVGPQAVDKRPRVDSGAPAVSSQAASPSAGSASPALFSGLLGGPLAQPAASVPASPPANSPASLTANSPALFPSAPGKSKAQEMLGPGQRKRMRGGDSGADKNGGAASASNVVHGP